MPSSSGYLDYPVPPPPPPLPVEKRWLWVAVLFTIGSLIAIAGSFVILAIFSTNDFKDYIDNDRILAVVEHECDRMTKTVDSITVSGTLRQQAAAIRAQDVAVEKMVKAVRAIDPDLLDSDEPTLQWVADWDQLVNLRSVFAAEVERGHDPEFEEPTDLDGDPILDRMDFASEPECVVPDALLDPYPEDVEGV
ncbi:MAG: hypothetical protein ABIR57_04700 [Aeromicrobium sp.]